LYFASRVLAHAVICDNATSGVGKDALPVILVTVLRASSINVATEMCAKFNITFTRFMVSFIK
jgi:hypothetical protein